LGKTFGFKGEIKSKSTYRFVPSSLLKVEF